MKDVKKMTLSAILCALAVALMAPAAFVETIDLAMAAVASLTAVFVFLEIGSPYTYLVWIVTSLLMALLFPQSLLWAEYLLIFGVYPFLKGWIERLPRLFWPFVKGLFFNVGLLGLVGIMQWLFGVQFFGPQADVQLLIDLPFLEGNVPLALFLVWLLANVTLSVYDLFLTVAVRIYCARFREKFKRFLK